MRRVVRGKLEMAARVGVFERTHPSTEPGYIIILESLEKGLARAEVIAERQHNGLAVARSARTTRRERRGELHSQVLPHVIRVGEVAAKDRPDLAERFVLPSTSATYKTYLTAATAMLSLAETHRDLMVSKGLKAAALDDARRIVAEFDTATNAVRTGRQDHIGARTDLEVVTTELLEIVRVLDGINRYRFGKDPEALAEWNAAKQVPGPKVGRSSAPRAVTTTPKPGDVAPAA